MQWTGCYAASLPLYPKDITNQKEYEWVFSLPRTSRHGLTEENTAVV